MATISRENLGTLHDKITVNLTKDDYMPSFESALKKHAKNVNIQGFRKGNAPSGIVRKMYGPSIFGEEVYRSATSELEQYIQKENVEFIAQPMMMPPESEINISMQSPGEINFSFEIALKPDIHFPALENKNTTIPFYKINVGDETVDKEVVQLQRRFGTLNEQEEVTSAEDVIYCTYQMCDPQGNALTNAAATDDTKVVGNFPKDLSELLMGKKTDENILFKPAEMAQGATLEYFMREVLKADESVAEFFFKLTITKIGTVIPHDLDADLFAQVFPNDFVTSEAMFRDRLREELSKQYAYRAGERMKEEMYEKLIHTTPIDLPVAFLKKWILSNREQKIPEEQMEREFPAFEHQYRWSLITEKIIRENKLEVTFKDVSEHMRASILEYFGMEADEEPEWLAGFAKKQMEDEKAMEQTRDELQTRKLFDYLYTQFNVQEQEISDKDFFKLPTAHEMQH